jgi:hypothetical protein
MHHFDFISMLSSVTLVGIVAHAVNTYPMPKSAQGRWFLGVIQYIVGQRVQALQTMDGPGAAQAARDTAQGK